MSEVLDLTRALIARASVTPDDAGCQAMLAERLTQAGFDCESLRYGAVDNLWATHGGGDGPVLMMLGHTDVVPSGPLEAWTSHPFVPQIRDGVLYGRGAADMKGSVAAFVIAAERFVAAHPALCNATVSTAISVVGRRSMLTEPRSPDTPATPSRTPPT